MEYFVGLDVSETVNVCIVNAAGDILLEKKIAAEPAQSHCLSAEKLRFAIQAHRARSGHPRPGFMASCVQRGTARSALNAVTSRPG